MFEKYAVFVLFLVSSNEKHFGVEQQKIGLADLFLEGEKGYHRFQMRRRVLISPHIRSHYLYFSEFNHPRWLEC
jgi:hypothetical protein